MLRGGQRKEGSLQIQRPEETLNGNGNSWAVTPQKKADNTDLGKTGAPEADATNPPSIDHSGQRSCREAAVEGCGPWLGFFIETETLVTGN